MVIPRNTSKENKRFEGGCSIIKNLIG